MSYSKLLSVLNKIAQYNENLAIAYNGKYRVRFCGEMVWNRYVFELIEETDTVTTVHEHILISKHRFDNMSLISSSDSLFGEIVSNVLTKLDQLTYKDTLKNYDTKSI